MLDLAALVLLLAFEPVSSQDPASAGSQAPTSSAPQDQPLSEPPTPMPNDAARAHATIVVWGPAVSTSEDPAASRRALIEAELSAVGIESVAFVPARGGDTSAQLVETMRAHAADVAIWISADEDKAEMWRRTDRRVEHIAIVTGEADDLTFAVRCAEVSLALATAVARPEAASPSSSTVASVAAPRPRRRIETAPRWDVRVGVSLGGAARDVGLLLAPLLGTGVRLGRRRVVGLEAEVLATALPGRLIGPAGRASIGWVIARLHVGGWIGHPRGRVAAFAGAGAGVLGAWTGGRASGPYRGRRDATPVALVATIIDVAIVVSRRLRLRIGARLGIALPAIRVDTGGQAYRTAQPIGEGVVALEVFGPPRAAKLRAAR